MSEGRNIFEQKSVLLVQQPFFTLCSPVKMAENAIRKINMSSGMQLFYVCKFVHFPLKIATIIAHLNTVC